MTEPTPRQVLYALVAGGFIVVVLVLVIGSAVAGVSPTWWTFTMSAVLGGVTIWSTLHWRRTGPLVVMSIALLVVWTVGTLLVT